MWRSSSCTNKYSIGLFRQLQKLSKVSLSNQLLIYRSFLELRLMIQKQLLCKGFKQHFLSSEVGWGPCCFLYLLYSLEGWMRFKLTGDDPTLPLVTATFGHASQEIVNLLLCGETLPNVFDGRTDLGGGMFLKGISTSVEVGFLTLLESLNFCKVGQHLKCPKWPIWVVGSESHYTVLFALDMSVQKENELEERENLIRRKFDQQDQSEGGGFISVEGFHEFLRESNIRLPPEKVDSLCSSGFIVWSELWQLVLDLDREFGGLKDSSGLMGKKVFDLYHFNGIAKSDLNGSGRETSVQRPRLTKLRVSVPPRWTPEEFMADVAASSSSGWNDSNSKDTEMDKPKPPQHAPLVDCIRTRWPRSVCNWAGDPPRKLGFMQIIFGRCWIWAKEPDWLHILLFVYLSCWIFCIYNQQEWTILCYYSICTTVSLVWTGDFFPQPSQGFVNNIRLIRSVHVL